MGSVVGAALTTERDAGTRVVAAATARCIVISSHSAGQALYESRRSVFKEIDANVEPSAMVIAKSKALSLARVRLPLPRSNTTNAR